MDTKLFVRKQSGGMFSVIDKTVDFGNIWWVGSAVTGATDGAGYGQNPDAPFATLVYAETQASADDTIYVLQGHTETLASATGAAVMTLNTAGLKVIGLGRRTRRPTFLIDGHANNYVLLSGADTTIKNLIFAAGDADVIYAILIQADGVEVRKCHFKDNTGGENFLVGVSVGVADNDSDYFSVDGCHFYSPDAAATQAVLVNKNQTSGEIINNRIQGNFAAGYVIGCPNTEVMLDLLVENNRIDNDAADTVGSILFEGATSTGIICRNLSGDVDGDGTPFIFDGGTLCDNLHTGAVTKSGFVYPAIDT